MLDDYTYENEFKPPAFAGRCLLPTDRKLRIVYDVYKTSKATRCLASESDREIFAEAFTENDHLSTLSELCVRALAKAGTSHILAVAKESPLKLETYYDALDVNIPLKECFFIDDLQFWRRVVLEKGTDASLAVRKLDECDWKAKGISLKYVELVENCKAEYWNEEEMSELAKLVKEYVKEIHIKRLKSFNDPAFEYYLNSNTSEVFYSDSLLSMEISSDESSTTDETEIKSKQTELMNNEEISGEQLLNVKQVNKKPTIMIQNTMELDQHNEDMKSAFELEVEQMKQERRKARHLRNYGRQALRAEQAKKYAAREQRRRKLEERVETKNLPKTDGKKKSTGTKKPRTQHQKQANQIHDVFSIQVQPEPDDPYEDIPDDRNLAKMMQRYKNYKDPPEHCHHIDLSFVQYFENLIIFTLEFLGPALSENYDTCYFNFSYDDMTHLAKGLRTLKKLKVFRLRNSRMDTLKMQILTNGLKYVSTLEVIDFGHDQLNDDAVHSLNILIRQNGNVKSLELENNNFGFKGMESLSIFLSRQNVTPIEYLGLANNRIMDRGLKILSDAILGTNNIENLNLCCILCSSRGLINYVADELLRLHKPLKRLNIAGIPINTCNGKELIKALESNKNILYFDCRDCGLDINQEYEAVLIIRRNNYLASNPYVGDITKTEEDINEFLKKRKSSILQKVLNKLQKREERIEEYYLNKSSITSALNKSVNKLSVKHKKSSKSSIDRFSYNTTDIDGNNNNRNDDDDDDDVDNDGNNKPFKYDPNTFNLKQLREHIYIP